ncbi:hypothetical protein D5F53_23215 [Paenibacillus lautus]|uniref:Uncharacterized protein n=1 Tax=Paenibacillus lautus TaxID=1401 RepID=A0A385TNJ7_PAELA|nr:hypothetical protein D5F53_23215 [Paenibacillus lautus]
MFFNLLTLFLPLFSTFSRLWFVFRSSLVRLWFVFGLPIAPASIIHARFIRIPFVHLSIHPFIHPLPQSSRYSCFAFS